jgi:dihydroorotate dehydrogenase
MDVLRKGFDSFYDFIKPGVFFATAKNPEFAHHLFVGALNGLKTFGLSGLVLDNEANNRSNSYFVSNAAGFNKNGEIDPRLMKLLGFDRVVVGTVTADAWKGANKPRIMRFPKTGSLVNWMGLPGIGVEKVARRLEKYGEHGIPLTVNLMSTPEKKGNAVLKDLRRTIRRLREAPYVSRFELNISCPNTHGADGSIDARGEYTNQLEGMLGVVREEIMGGQKFYLKVSPDISRDDVDNLVRVGEEQGVEGYTIANTTTNHNPNYIGVSLGKGGASGNAVWDSSVRTQKYFANRVGNDVELIACGGINSVERMKTRYAIGNCNEIQIFTPLIFKGTGLLRKLRWG